MSCNGFFCILLSRNGQAWLDLRQPLQRLMLHPTAATAYLPAQNSVADKFLDLIDKSVSEDGELENLADFIHRYTMECNYAAVHT